MSVPNDKIEVKIDEAAAKAKGLAQEVGDKVRAAGKNPAGTTAGGVMEAVKERVRDATAGASRLMGQAEDTAQVWASSVGDAAVQAKDRTRDVAAAAAEGLGDLGQDLTAFIRRHPLESLLMGFGVGVGMGFLVAQVMPRR